MHINLNGKQRSYDYLSIHSTQNTISGEYNNHRERQYPSIFIVSIAGDQNIFYLQIKEYPFVRLVLGINPKFSKTSCFLPFHSCFPSGPVVRDFMIKLFYQWCLMLFGDIVQCTQDSPMGQYTYVLRS